MIRTFHYAWEWQLRSTPGQLWPYVSDTLRFNRATTGYSVKVIDEDDDGMHQVRARYLSVPLAWDKHPFEWERPHHFSVARKFHGGILRDFSVRATLTPNDAGICLRYEVTACPATVLGSITIPIQIGAISRRCIELAFHRIDAFLQDPIGRRDPSSSGSIFVTGKAAQRLRAIGLELQSDG